MHCRLGSMTLVAAGFPRGKQPEFLWEKSQWDNTVVNIKKNKKKLLLCSIDWWNAQFFVSDSSVLNECSLPHLIVSGIFPYHKTCTFTHFEGLKSTSLLLCSYTLACEPDMVATLWGFCTEYYLWCSYFLKMLGWLTVLSPLSCWTVSSGSHCRSPPPIILLKILSAVLLLRLILADS